MSLPLCRSLVLGLEERRLSRLEGSRSLLLLPLLTDVFMRWKQELASSELSDYRALRTERLLAYILEWYLRKDLVVGSWPLNIELYYLNALEWDCCASLGGKTLSEL